MADGVDVDSWVSLAVVVAAGIWYSTSWARAVGGRYLAQVRDWFEADPDPVDEIHRAYRDGEIDEQQLEKRLEMHMDTRNERIRDELLEIDGVGGAVASEVAVSFESVGAVAAADLEELTDVQDVGEVRADRIQSHFAQ